MLARPGFQQLDGDLALGARPPQRAWELDPRWQTCFFHGLGNGPYGMQPFQTRGTASTWTLTGSAVVGTAPDGWGLTTTLGGSTYLGTASMGFSLNQSQGACVITGRLNAALSTTTVQFFVLIGTAGTNQFKMEGLATANFSIGWDGSSNTFISVAKPTTSAGQLFVFSCDWSSTGTRAYWNGASLGSSGTAPGTGATSGGLFRIGGSTSGGMGSPIYSIAFLDRALDASEHGYIARNPFTWAFEPSLLRAWDVLGGPAWGWENLSDMMPRPQRRQQLALQRFDDPSYPFTATVTPTQTGWDVIPPRPQPWRQTKLPINYRVDVDWFPFTATITPQQTGWDVIPPRPQPNRQVKLPTLYPTDEFPFTATPTPTQTGWDVIPPPPRVRIQKQLPVEYPVDEFPFTATITPSQTGWDVIPPRPQPRRQVRLQPPYPVEDFPFTGAVTPGPLGWLALDQFPLYRRQAPKVWYDADLSPPGAQQTQVLGYLTEDQPGRRPARLAPRWFLDDLPPLATAPQGWQVELQFPPARRLSPRWQQLAEEFIFTATVTPQPLGWHTDPLVPQPRRRNVQNYSPDENPFGVPITPAALGWHVDPLRPQAYRLVSRRWQEQDIWNVQVAVTPGPLGWQVEALLPLGKRVQIGWVLEPPESPQAQAVLTPGPLGWEPVMLDPPRLRPKAPPVPDLMFDVVVVAPLVSHLPPPRYGLFHVLGRWLKR